MSLRPRPRTDVNVTDWSQDSVCRLLEKMIPVAIAVSVETDFVNAQLSSTNKCHALAHYLSADLRQTL